MLMLAFVFQNLSRRKPDLDSGIYAYAKAGFGDYPGFASAVGYWIGCCLADTACLTLIKATLGQFFPVFGDGTTLVAIISASVLLWGVHILVLRGIKQAAALNTIATYAKVVPIFVFILVVIFAFRADVFAANFWGGQAPSFASISAQVRGTMLVTVFVFVGIEGASVYSRYATDRNDVGIATVLGFLGVLILLVFVTVLSYRVLPRAELAGLATPSMAGVMQAIVGPWGAAFISVGLLISVLGNYLFLFPDAFAPQPSSILHQLTIPARAVLPILHSVLPAVTWFAEYSFTLALKMTSSMSFIPYLLVATYVLSSMVGAGIFNLPGRSRPRPAHSAP